MIKVNTLHNSVSSYNMKKGDVEDFLKGITEMRMVYVYNEQIKKIGKKKLN